MQTILVVLSSLTTQLREVFCVFSRFFALCNGLLEKKSPPNQQGKLFSTFVLREKAQHLIHQL